MRYTTSDLTNAAEYLTETLHAAGIAQTAFVYQANGSQCIAIQDDSDRGNVVREYATEYGTKAEVMDMYHAYMRGFSKARRDA